jgi:hypothetical protein
MGVLQTKRGYVNNAPGEALTGCKSTAHNRCYHDRSKRDHHDPAENDRDDGIG